MKFLKISLVLIIASWLLVILVGMWFADKDYAYGKNLDSVSHFAEAYPYLKNAVDANPNEPSFRDELSYNEAVLASGSYSTATESAKTLANEAIQNSNKVVEDFPNSMPFWKTRTRVFYQLASINPKFTFEALASIQKAANLAPTDAKVHYNLGILLGRTNQIKEAEKVLEETIAMKIDYRDAYYTLGLFYQQDKNLPKAREQMELIIKRIGPDKEALKWLEENK